MKHLLLINNILFLAFLTILGTSCGKDDCMNIEELDRQHVLIQDWFVHDSIQQQTLVDSHGITETFAITSRRKQYIEDIVEDDCGVNYGSRDFVITYQSSLTRDVFDIDISGVGTAEFPFRMLLSISTKDKYLRTTYNFDIHQDFRTKSTKEKDAMVSLESTVVVSGKEYKDVLVFSFNKTESPTEIKTVYYAKKFGIIKFVKANGNEFMVK